MAGADLTSIKARAPADCHASLRPGTRAALWVQYRLRWYARYRRSTWGPGTGRRVPIALPVSWLIRCPAGDLRAVPGELGLAVMADRLMSRCVLDI